MSENKIIENTFAITAKQEKKGRKKKNGMGVEMRCKNENGKSLLIRKRW